MESFHIVYGDHRPFSDPVACRMAASKDWMFCPLTGSLLTLDAASGVARCPISGWQRKLEGATVIPCSACFGILSFLESALLTKRTLSRTELNGSVTLSRSNIQVRECAEQIRCPLLA